MIYLAAFLFMCALFLLSQANRKRKETGLPGGQIIYTDTNNWSEVEKPLYDPRIDLAGKPDYLVRQGNAIIPVEVKSSRVGQAPYDSHIFQLAAYCRLVEREFKVRPTHGILHYSNRTFRIDYTPELEEEMIGMIIEMRSISGRKQASRSHEAPQRCARCGYQSMCDQRLA